MFQFQLGFLVVMDYGNATSANIPSYQLKRLQSLMNSAARLMFHRPNSTTPHSAPLSATLAECSRTRSVQARVVLWLSSATIERHRRNWSMSSASPRTDHAYDHAASASSLPVRRIHTCSRQPSVIELLWSPLLVPGRNAVPRHGTSASYLPVFCGRLKTHLIPWLCSAGEVT